MAKIAVLGSTNVDVRVEMERFPQPGQTLHGKSLMRSAGGKGANQALAAQMSGAKTVFLGATGNDSDSRIALNLLQENGVDITKVVCKDDPTGTAFVFVDGNGENQIVVIPGANFAITAADLEAWEPIMADVKYIVMQGEIPAFAIDYVAEKFPRKLVLNLAPVIAASRDAITKCAILIVNETESRETLELMGGNATGKADPDVVRELQQQGIPIVILTRGGNSTLIANEESIQEIPARKVPVVDTTGAGDAFVGALVAGLAQDQSIAAAAEAASSFAARSITKPGAQASYIAAVNESIPAV